MIPTATVFWGAVRTIASETQLLGFSDGSSFAWIECRSIFAAGVSIGKIVESEYALFATVADKFNLFWLSGFETYCGSRRNIKVVAKRGGAIETHIAIYLKKVVVWTHLNGAVAGIFNTQFKGGAMTIIAYIRGG